MMGYEAGLRFAQPDRRMITSVPDDHPMRNRTVTCWSRALWIAVVCTLAVPAAADAQRSPRQERNFIGNLINQDYFTAVQYPEVLQMLNMVNNFHSGERVWNNFHNGDFVSVQADCEFILRYFPNHPSALHLVAEVGKATNRPGYAIKYFEAALKEYPHHAYTHAQYGNYLVGIGAVSAGIHELKESLRMDPELLIAWAWLSDA